MLNRAAAMSHPPLKRHPALQPLSRDHYVGLVHAQRLIQSAEVDAPSRQTAVLGFLTAWSEEIAQHFADEERLFGGLIPNPADQQRLHDEHAIIRRFAEEAVSRVDTADPGAPWVRQVGQTLNDHIRWEERELFPAIEQAINAQQLAALQEETDAIESNRPRSACRPRGSGVNQEEKK
jgi:hemerythrin-like domain-containing protein